jgi:hypothetical protein
MNRNLLILVILVFLGFFILATACTGKDYVANHDSWVVKVDANGTHQWTMLYDKGGDERPESIINTYDEGFALLVDDAEYGGLNGTVHALKLGKNGTLQWDREVSSGRWAPTGGPQGVSIFPLQDNGYIILDSSGQIIKTDQNGNVYQRLETNLGVVEAAILTKDNNLVLGGLYRNITSGERHRFLSKLDINGSLLWKKTYEISELSTDSIYETSDGGFLLMMVSAEQIQIMKTDKQGDITWVSFNENHVHDIQAIRELDGGKYDIVYPFMDQANPRSVHERIIDKNGTIIKDIPFKGGYGIVGTWADDGSYVSAGLPDFMSEPIMRKINADGTGVWNSSFDIPHAYQNKLLSIVQSGDGGFALLGYNQN